MKLQPSNSIIPLFTTGLPLDEDFQGFYLSSETCPEHNSGIVPMMNIFDIEGHQQMVKYHKVSNVTDTNLRLYELDDALYLLGGDLTPERSDDEIRSYGIPPDTFRTLRGGWCESGFVLAAGYDKGKAQLRKLYDAFQSHDAAIFLGSRLEMIPTGDKRPALYVCIYHKVSHIERTLNLYRAGHIFPKMAEGRDISEINAVHPTQ